MLVSPNVLQTLGHYDGYAALNTTFEAAIMRDPIHLGDARLIFVPVGPGAHRNLTFEQRAGFGPPAFDARRQALAIGGAHPNE